MYHENSMRIVQSELASEYRRYKDSKSKNVFIRLLIKGLVIPLFALALLLAGGAFLIANNSPDTYAQAKDMLFAKVDVEKLTGIPASIASEQLDSWLIVNPTEHQGAVVAQEETGIKPATKEASKEYPLN